MGSFGILWRKKSLERNILERIALSSICHFVQFEFTVYLELPKLSSRSRGEIVCCH